MFNYLVSFLQTSPYQVGDVIFLALDNALFRKVAQASGSWTNHVGIIIGHDGTDWIVAESCVPVVRKQRLRDFIARSADGRHTVRRLPRRLDVDEVIALQAAVEQRLGTPYHTGFALHSRRQFCSKFVREVLLEACGESIGTVETFETLLRKNPQTPIGFWRLWFFGFIPWQRETVTPASLLRCPKLLTVLG